jgi:caffeoyl-CoA O-methyltransferase
MEKAFGQGDPKLSAYAERVFKPEDPVLAEIRERSTREGLPEIQVGRMDGLLLELLARASGAKKAVEIGTLGGYSGVCLLRGMGSSGVLHTCELSEHHAQVARRSFELAGVASQAKILVGPALKTLSSLESQAPFDLCFIDADKESYPAYLDWAASHLRVGGTVLADNTFAWNRIADPPTGEGAEGVRALQAFNQTLAQSPRFRATILPTSEGLTVGVKLR